MLPLKMKFAIRALSRSGIFTYANILGLAISIGALITIYIYVSSEMGTDSHFSSSEEIYRVVREVEDSQSSYQSPTLAGPFRELISYELNIPQEDILRIYQEDELVSYQGASFFESNVIYADSNFFHLLDYPLQLGQTHNALKSINAAVISDRIAQKYFGDRNPIGEVLEIDGKGLLEIVGVLEKPRTKSHLDLDFVVNNGSMGYSNQFLTDQETHAMTYYLRVPEENMEVVVANLKSLSQKHLNKAGSGAHASLSLQALSDIYFDKAMSFDFAQHGNRSFLQTLMAISFVLMFLLAANFINLTVAKLSKGLRQIGVKKVLGSSKRSLIFDWSLEVYLHVLLATCLGAVGCNFVLPSLMEVYEINLVLPDTLHLLAWGFAFTLLLTALIIAIPGWLFSSVKSFAALSDKFGVLKTHSLQYILLLFQFTIAFVLIVFTVVINRQYHYMQEKELGLADEQVLIFNSNNKHSWQNRDHIRNEILQLSGVKDVSMTYGGLPTGPTESLSYLIDQSTYQWHTAFIQPNLIELLELQILDGQAFNEQIDSEMERSVLLNEKAAGELGWPQQNLIGKSLSLAEDSSSKRILGIVQDYHYESFKKEIEPLVLQASNWEESFVVKMEGREYLPLLSKIEGIWQSYVPKYPFSYRFLDETFQHMHQEDTQNGKIIFLFTFLTIIIASIGTLSLISFIQQLKVKEFAIRKILGASMARIFYVQSSTLLKVLVLSGLLALPLAWFFATDWLSDFSYRISLSPLIFLIAYSSLIGMLLILLIAQSWSLATSNPIDSLKKD